MLNQKNETTFSEPLNEFKAYVGTKLYLYTIVW